MRYEAINTTLVSGALRKKTYSQAAFVRVANNFLAFKPQWKNL